MPGLNLEAFKVGAERLARRASPVDALCSRALLADLLTNHQFGVYLMFPIGFMYYFGTNLDNRFTVPDFWPRPEECNKLPRDRDELKIEYDRMIAARQRFKQARFEEEQQRAGGEGASDRGNDS